MRPRHRRQASMVFELVIPLGIMGVGLLALTALIVAMGG